MGPRGPSRAPALALPESSSACLLLRRMAWSSRCSRIPKPETKGGPGDEDAFEDGLGNRNARLEEGTGLTTVPLEIRVTALRVRAIAPSQAFRGARAERTSVENSTLGKSAEIESGARPAPTLQLQQSQEESSRVWKETVWRSEEGEAERRSIGPCQRPRGLEGSHPVSTSRDSWITVCLGYHKYTESWTE